MVFFSFLYKNGNKAIFIHTKSGKIEPYENWRKRWCEWLWFGWQWARLFWNIPFFHAQGEECLCWCLVCVGWNFSRSSDFYGFLWVNPSKVALIILHFDTATSLFGRQIYAISGNPRRFDGQIVVQNNKIGVRVKVQGALDLIDAQALGRVQCNRINSID